MNYWTNYHKSLWLFPSLMVGVNWRNVILLLPIVPNLVMTLKHTLGQPMVSSKNWDFLECLFSFLMEMMEHQAWEEPQATVQLIPIFIVQLEDAHTLLLQYMRALLLLCLATLTVFSVVLTLIGVPYGMLLASVAFMLEFIPMIGPLSAALIILAISFYAGYHHLLALVLFLGIYRLFQDYVLSPHLMRRGVELHPLAVIFGIFAGGELGGVAGIFLSVPTLALIRLIYYRMTNPVRRSRPVAAVT